jgi:hypothetical protein
MVRTPTPIPVTTQAPVCILGVELVEVQQQFRFWYVGSRPTFVLVLRNSGECPWPEGTALELVSPNPLGWPESWAVGSVEVDEVAEVEIRITAPSTPQTLELVWQLQGPNGELIGSEITHTVGIAQRPTTTPTGPPSPAPSTPSSPTPTHAGAPPPPPPITLTFTSEPPPPPLITPTFTSPPP